MRNVIYYGGGAYHGIDYLKIYAVLSTPSVLRAIKLPPNLSFLCVGHEAPNFF